MKELRNKSKYKVCIYSIITNNEVEKIVENHEMKPNINHYANYFAPKLSTTYAIHFYKLNEDNHYKLYESWFKCKRGWKRVL